MNYNKKQVDLILSVYYRLDVVDSSSESAQDFMTECRKINSCLMGINYTSGYARDVLVRELRVLCKSTSPMLTRSEEVREAYSAIKVGMNCLPVTSNSHNLHIDGHSGTWYVIDTSYYNGYQVFLLEHEEYGDDAACLIVDASGVVIREDVWNGFLELNEGRDDEEDE